VTSILDELAWRGLVAQCTDLSALDDALAAGPITVYCGFDPTAPSLHHGHLVQLILLRHLQLAGHRVVALVGGATGLIGDPRMSGERVLNTKDTVAEWVVGLRRQISRFLDFEGDNPAIMVNNYDWTESLSAIDLLRDIGKNFRLGTMLAKDTVARRLESAEGISYTEFSYQILQAIDFLELYERHGCILQTGGNDQWGNLLGGVELIRKVKGVTVHALTTPLISKADGTKFGKSEGGAIWLDPEMMSPYAFYQHWVNSDDADVVGWLKTFTFRTPAEIAELEKELAERPGARAAQRALAHDVTAFVHGEAATAAVISASGALFGGGELAEIDPATLAAAVDELPSAEVVVGSELIDALAAAGLVAGRGAARRTIGEGGIYLNNVKVADEAATLTEADFLHGKFAVLRRGKRTLAVARRVD
jgi:tyrosyl-tRNA synthetase